MTSSLAGRGHSFPRADRPGGRWQPAERRRSGDRRGPLGPGPTGRPAHRRGAPGGGGGGGGGGASGGGGAPAAGGGGGPPPPPPKKWGGGPGVPRCPWG